MRTQLLVALAFLCGAAVAHADDSPPAPAANPAPAAGCADGGCAPAAGGGGGGLFGFAGDGDGKCWVTAGGLIAYIRTQQLPIPPFTTGPDGPGAGAIGTPGTRALLGQSIEYDALYGFQGEIGKYLDDARMWSVDVRGFYLFESSKSFNFASDAGGNPLITRPFFNALSNTESAFFNASPGEASGTAFAEARAELFGGEVNGRANFGSAGGVRGNVLLGFRYLRLNESLVIRDTLRPLAPGILTFLGADVNPPDSIADQDSFSTKNSFYGGQIGGQLLFDISWLTVGVFSKVALGATDQKATISGSSTLTTAAGSTTVPGGVLAVETNSGTHSRTVLGIVPEWGMNLGVNLSQNIRVTGGYSFLMWSRVARPGTIIDRAVNPSYVPTDPAFGTAPVPPAPQFRFADNDGAFWVHTFNAGLELVF